MLGLDTPDGSSAEDQARLALLREVLQAYCGYKPYQNYAGNRSQYVGQKAKGECVACCVGWDAAGRHTVVQRRHTGFIVHAHLLIKVCCCLAWCCRAAQRRKERREAREASEASSDALSSSEAEDASAAAATPEPVAAASTAADPDANSSSAVVKEAKKRGKKKGHDSEGGEESEADTKADAALYAAAAADYSGEGPVPPELQWRQQVRQRTACCRQLCYPVWNDTTAAFLVQLTPPTWTVECLQWDKDENGIAAELSSPGAALLLCAVFRSASCLHRTQMTLW